MSMVERLLTITCWLTFAYVLWKISDRAVKFISIVILHHQWKKLNNDDNMDEDKKLSAMLEISRKINELQG